MPSLTSDSTRALGLQVAWRKQLGPGNSRIAVVDGRAITLFSDGESDNLVALDASSGEEIWRYRIAPTYRGHDASHDGPHASPVVDNGIVYGLGPQGHLVAVDFDNGSEVWSLDIIEQLGARAPFWGFASTPVVDGDALIVQTGGFEQSVSAFDKHSGEILWSVGSDRVGYQSPAVMILAGRRQVVSVTNRLLMGIAPERGEILWTQEHNESDLDGSSEPVSIGEDRFLLTSSATEHQSTARLYRVTKDDAGPAVEEIWRSDALKGSYAVPVLYEGRLYGFQRGFLTCVDLDSGKAIWKSRPPGGYNLVLVGNHLVIFAAKGFLVMAAASAEGYDEVARVRVFDRGAYTAPTVADDMVFVRNQSHIAAIRIGEFAQQMATGPEGRGTIRAEGAFASFLRNVEVAPDKQRLVDDFMRSQSRFPIVEESDLVHFVFQGAATDVAIWGSMTDWGSPDPLRRIPGTDFFYRSYSFEPASRWEYMFQVDIDQYARDPLNPRSAPGQWGEVSELVMPGWVEPDHLREPSGERGRIESFEFSSETLGNRREVKVYLPMGYSAGEGRYPLLIVLDGLKWLEHGLMDRSLDNLIGRRVAPLLAAFVGPPKGPRETFQEAGGPQAYREYGGPRTPQHARMLARELVPHLAQTYRTFRWPDSRAVIGIGSPGLAALYAAVHYPDVFGKVAVQSLKLGPTPLQSSRLRRRPVFDAAVAALGGEEKLPLEFYLDWASHDLRDVEFGIDLRRESRELADLLRRKGYSAVGREHVGGPGWGSWRVRTDRILEAFFPLERQR